MNDERARALARRFMDTKMRVPRSDVGGCPVAACPREAFEVALMRLIQSAATEASSPFGILLEKLARIDTEFGSRTNADQVGAN